MVDLNNSAFLTNYAFELMGFLASVLISLFIPIRMIPAGTEMRICACMRASNTALADAFPVIFGNRLLQIGQNRR